MRNSLLVLSVLFIVNFSWCQDVFDAARSGNTELIEVLWNQNNDTINAKDGNGFTPLILATYHSQLSTVELLISKEVDVNYNSQEGTALLGASYKGNIEISQLLINAGTDVNKVGGRGATALLYAVQSSNYELVKLLIEKGADIHVKDSAGRTALDYANKMNLKKIQSLLK